MYHILNDFDDSFIMDYISEPVLTFPFIIKTYLVMLSNGII